MTMPVIEGKARRQRAGNRATGDKAPRLDGGDHVDSGVDKGMGKTRKHHYPAATGRR